MSDDGDHGLNEVQDLAKIAVCFDEQKDFVAAVYYYKV